MIFISHFTSAKYVLRKDKVKYMGADKDKNRLTRIGAEVSTNRNNAICNG